MLRGGEFADGVAGGEVKGFPFMFVKRGAAAEDCSVRTGNGNERKERDSLDQTMRTVDGSGDGTRVYRGAAVRLGEKGGHPSERGRRGNEDDTRDAHLLRGSQTCVLICVPVNFMITMGRAQR